MTSHSLNRHFKKINHLFTVVKQDAQSSKSKIEELTSRPIPFKKDFFFFYLQLTIKIFGSEYGRLIHRQNARLMRRPPANWPQEKRIVFHHGKQQNRKRLLRFY
jgi:hypothetical protein